MPRATEKPPAKWEGRLRSAFPLAASLRTTYCFGLAGSAGIVVLTDGAVVVLVVVLNCCADFTKLCGFAMSSLFTSG